MNADTTLQELAAQITGQLAEAMRHAAAIPPDRRLIDKEWLCNYFGRGMTAVERIIAQPTFPEAIKIPGGPLRWKAADVYEWAEQQRAPRAKRMKRNDDA
jgi:predicted DNA-binding transcriptional regulator AlpA